MTLPLVGWFALFLPLVDAPDVPAMGKDQASPVVLTGKVVELTAALKASGLAYDQEPVAKQVVLKKADGSLIPLLSDEASRALFLDERLRNRPIEIVGRSYRGLPYVQAVSFKVDDHGEWRTPEYFCEICTISVRYPQVCPCCQGPMILRMRPEAR